MAREIEQAGWETFLSEFGERNGGRRTRLGVIKMEDGVQEDFWLEDGLPLAGLSVESDDDSTTHVQIMLGGGEASNNMTHVVHDVRQVRCEEQAVGAGGLEIEAEDGSTTVLRFEA